MSVTKVVKVYISHIIQLTKYTGGMIEQSVRVMFLLHVVWPILWPQFCR